MKKGTTREQQGALRIENREIRLESPLNLHDSEERKGSYLDIGQYKLTCNWVYNGESTIATLANVTESSALVGMGVHIPGMSATHGAGTLAKHRSGMERKGSYLDIGQ